MVTRQISGNYSKNRNRQCLNTCNVFLEVSTAFIKVIPALEFYDRPLKEMTNMGKGSLDNKGSFFAKGFCA